MVQNALKVAKHNRPLTLEKVKLELERKFPEYEYYLLAKSGQGLTVKKSNFVGARIDIANHEIRIKGKPPELLPSLIDIGLLGLISSAASPRIVNNLKKFLKEKFAD
jgi:hypothetical protein